jgi:osmoprotectant transport system substrate-binding protein
MVHFRKLAVVAMVVPVIALTACGGGKKLGGSSGGGGGSKGTVVISGQNYTEMLIMGSVYQQVLEKAGYKTQFKPVATRNLYVPGLEKGSIDVVPEYLSSMTDALNQQINGADSKSVASSNVDKTLATLKSLGAKKGLDALTPAKAADQNAFFVTKKYASANSLSSLSDLGSLGKPITLAAASDCPTRAECKLGLKSVYNVTVKKVLPLGFGTTQTKNSVKKGESQLGETGTTDGSLDALGFVILKDDKGWQHAENLVPVVNATFLAKHADLTSILDKLSATLTTADLAAMNAKVDNERQKPADVAKDYLTSKGLI